MHQVEVYLRLLDLFEDADLPWFETILEAKTELDEDLWLGNKLLNCLPYIAGWSEKQLASEDDDLSDLWDGHSERLQFREIAGLDLLEGFEDGPFLPQSLLIEWSFLDLFW